MRIYLCSAFDIFPYDTSLSNSSAFNGLGLLKFRYNSKDANRKTSLGPNKRVTSPLQSLHVHGETQRLIKQTYFDGSSGVRICIYAYAP